MGENEGGTPLPFDDLADPVITLNERIEYARDLLSDLVLKIQARQLLAKEIPVDMMVQLENLYVEVYGD